MAFSKPIFDIENEGAGLVSGVANLIISSTAWADNLTYGVFVQPDANGILQIASDASKPAFVSLRRVTSDLDSGEKYNKELFDTVDILASGLVTVSAVAGLAPKYLAQIGFETTGANAGKANLKSGDLNAYFIRAVRDDVWLIMVK